MGFPGSFLWLPGRSIDPEADELSLAPSVFFTSDRFAFRKV